MQNLGNYLDEKRHKDIIDEILDLKLEGPKTQKTKLKIQKLQQEMIDIENRLKIYSITDYFTLYYVWLYMDSLVRRLYSY